jgi:hypothetical protein
MRIMSPKVSTNTRKLHFAHKPTSCQPVPLQESLDALRKVQHRGARSGRCVDRAISDWAGRPLIAGWCAPEASDSSGSVALTLNMPEDREGLSIQYPGDAATDGMLFCRLSSC